MCRMTIAMPGVLRSCRRTDGVSACWTGVKAPYNDQPHQLTICQSTRQPVVQTQELQEDHLPEGQSDLRGPVVPSRWSEWCPEIPPWLSAGRTVSPSKNHAFHGFGEMDKHCARMCHMTTAMPGVLQLPSQPQADCRTVVWRQNLTHTLDIVVSDFAP